MNGKRLGNLLRDRRKAAGLSVAELAQAVGITREVLGKYERGSRANPLAAEYANAIAETLKNVSVLEIVMAMGYRISITGFDADELALVDEYRRLTRPHRAGLYRTAQALRESQDGGA